MVRLIGAAAARGALAEAAGLLRGGAAFWAPALPRNGGGRRRLRFAGCAASRAGVATGLGASRGGEPRVTSSPPAITATRPIAAAHGRMCCGFLEAACTAGSSGETSLQRFGWRDSLHSGFEWQTTLAAEVFEIFSGVRDRRMVGRERGRCDRRGAPIERLGIAEPSSFFREDREVIQGAREIRMDRTKLGLLNPGGGREQLIGGRKVTGDRCAFCLLDKVLGVRSSAMRSQCTRGLTLSGTLRYH